MAMCLPALFITACLYYVIWQTVAYELAIPELIAESLIPVLHRVNLILLIGLPLFFAITLYFAARLTNRFASPLCRIEKSIQEMIEEKNFSKPIYIRKNDDLHDLVKQINNAFSIASKG